jgi:energy-coupling factor transporter transmembrane protein EcfT
MAIAMEARCYMGGSGRTRFLQLTARPIDYVATAFMFALVGAIWFYTVPLLSTIVAAVQAVI